MLKYLLYPIALLRILFIIILLIIVVIPYFLLSRIFKNTPERAFYIRRQWVKVARLIMGLKITYETQAHSKPVLYVCNHRSFSDPLVFAGYLDAFVIAKAEVADLPLISTGAELTGIIYVKRDDKKSRTAVREKMIEVLLSGYSVLVYPEGTTSGYKTTLPYKAGTFIEAAKHGIPVVPVVQEYKSKKDLWVNSSMVAHHFKQFSSIFTTCWLAVGPELRSDDGIELKEKAEKWTNDKIAEIHQSWGTDFLKPDPELV